MEQANPFDKHLKEVNVGDKTYRYYSLKQLNDSRLEKLPYSVRILLECAVRNCNEFSVKSSDIEKILDWQVTSNQDVEIPFKPSRVILQDFTGVPAVVDLAGMRDAVNRLGKDPNLINPLCPVDLVIDHSVQVDNSRSKDALEQNEAIEFKRNQERFQFLKWGQSAFKNFLIVPPGSGIVHQVNLEYLAKVVFNRDGLLYPDSVVGTDSHTTMINGLGVLGWGVGGIEAEAVMMGQNISMVLPQVVGFKFTGKLPDNVTATDLVLTCTDLLRKRKVVGKFVEFFGPGVESLNLADRATVSNMAPEYGATMGYFPIDNRTVEYLRLTGRTEEQVAMIEAYLKDQGLFREYDGSQTDPEYSGPVMELDLSSVKPSVSGPKRPHDRVTCEDMKKDWASCLSNTVGFKGYGLSQQQIDKKTTLLYQGKEYEFNHGSIVIAAITSCTNTSNPGVILAAGLLAKNAIAKGLTMRPYIKTSLSPGSGVVTKYIEAAGLQDSFDKLGFNVAGYGCMTCIGNSGELDAEVSQQISENDLVAAAILSGNRNFEGRVHPLTRANYLGSPPLVVAYALAGRIDIDFESEPIANDQAGNPIFLRDIWPGRSEVDALVNSVLKPEMFIETYQKIAQGTSRWNALEVPEGNLFQWSEKSTYIHDPPFFKSVQTELPTIKNIENAYCLLNLGDSITTDHISPAGNIAKNSPAGRFLQEAGIAPTDFNSYGARRGNDLIMARGTFANARMLNKFMNGKVGPQTVHHPSNQVMDIYDAAQKYQSDGDQTIIFAGNEYGSGSSRDWAAKGPFLQGVKAVVACSYERIHRSNLVGMGILPLEFKKGENLDTYGITGTEQFSINLNGGDLRVNQDLEVSYGGKSFVAKVRLDTDPEVEYFKNGGILNYVLRRLVK